MPDSDGDCCVCVNDSTPRTIYPSSHHTFDSVTLVLLVSQEREDVRKCLRRDRDGFKAQSLLARLHSEKSRCC
jgi:hypothetical protein